MEKIKIFKGNDTDFNNGQFLIFNISAVIDISSFSGIFKLGSFTATGNLKDGSMEIIIPNQITSQFPLGNMCGSFTLVDTKNRLATVSNTIPFEITNIPFTPQAATIDLDVPEGYPVNISMQLGVEYVKQSDYNDDKAAMQAEINGKQAQLSAVQLLAVNSGITSTSVAQIATNTYDIGLLQTALQNLSFVEFVVSLPTQDIKTGVIYCVPLNETDLSGKTIVEEFIYNNNQWYAVGAFSTNIDASTLVLKSMFEFDSGTGTLNINLAGA